MDANLLRLKTEYAKFVQQLKDDQYIDDQFLQLVQLVDDSTPNFVGEVVTLFFEDSRKLIEQLGGAMHQNPTDYNTIAANVHQLKGSSSSIGAKRVRNACVDFREYCEQRNYEGCVVIFKKLFEEFFAVQGKLQDLFKKEHAFMAAGGTLSNLHMGVFT